MSESEVSIAGQALAESAETMAFLSLLPAEQPFAMPDQMLCVRIGFAGPTPGTLELAAPESFGALLAANMLGCDPSDADASARAVDAIKELINVTCGAMLSRLTGGQGHGYEMSLPAVEPLENRSDWEELLNHDPGCAFDAEGHFLAVRVIGGPQC